MPGARIALATCAELPTLDPDDQLLLAELPNAEPVVWDDPAAEWDAYALVAVRSTWDYAGRREEFLAWAGGLGDRVVNPSAVLRWNTDKRYLADLDGAGVPVVPTTFLEPGAPFVPPDGPFVVKPTVSAGSRDTARYGAGTPERERGAEHVAALHAAGRTAMVQPYVEDVDTAGETALLYLGGAYSHAIRKGPILREGEAPTEALYAPEEVEAREPQAAELAVGERVAALLAERFGGPLSYVRVDLLGGGEPLVLEVELTEPSLFFAHGEGSARRLAADLTRRASAASSAAPR